MNLEYRNILFVALFYVSVLHFLVLLGIGEEMAPPICHAKQILQIRPWAHASGFKLKRRLTQGFRITKRDGDFNQDHCGTLFMFQKGRVQRFNE